MSFGVASEAAVILLREGLEAMLVVMALAAYLGKLGLRERLRALHAGVTLGVLASLIAAWLLARFRGGEHDDLLEAATLLLAAGLLTYVSGWLFIRQDPRAWQAYLRGRIEGAGTGPWAIFGVAFLAVFREGAETALFLAALARGDGGSLAALALGIVVGIGGLAVLFAVMRSVSLRLPLRPLFLCTSALLFLMALRFAGAAVQELQELGLIGVSDVNLPNWLIELGVNATAEGLSLQALMILGAGATTLAMLWSASQRTLSQPRRIDAVPPGE